MHKLELVIFPLCVCAVAHFVTFINNSQRHVHLLHVYGIFFEDHVVYPFPFACLVANLCLLVLLESTVYFSRHTSERSCILHSMDSFDSLYVLFNSDMIKIFRLPTYPLAPLHLWLTFHIIL